MSRSRTLVLAIVGALSAASLSLACDPGGVGDPCTPEDEFHNEFSGYAASEVNVESRSFQCETRVCIVNHFQGRVSCPYGQSEEDLALPDDAPERCRIPGTDGTRQGDAIDVPVKPWRTDRTADDAVYCSCRCDGPDPNANYCECPSGFACVELVEDLSLGREQLAGSYCIKDGTRFSPGPAPDCGTTPNAPGCPEPAGVNP